MSLGIEDFLLSSILCDNPVITIMLFYDRITVLDPAESFLSCCRKFLSAIIIICVGVITTAWMSMADDIKLDAIEMRTNYFENSQAGATFHFSSHDGFKGTLYWNLMLDNRTLDRAERSISVRNKKDLIFHMDLKIPHVRENIVLPIDFNMSIYGGNKDRPALSHAERLWIFSAEPFRNRQKQLKALNIYLFDPRKRTSMLFSGSGIPFKPLGSVDALSRITNALIIIGEGTSLNVFRGLTDVMASSASAGNTVLCLSPDSGIFPLPLDHDRSKNLVCGFHLRRSDIIHALDKHLDLSVWTSPHNPGTGVQGVAFKVQKSRIYGEVIPGDGWPWVDIDFNERGGRLTFCGFSLLEAWESSPAPRYLLAGILQNYYERLNASGSKQ